MLKRSNSSKLTPSTFSSPNIQPLSSNQQCFECNEMIENGEPAVYFENKYFHPEHFICEKCDAIIKDTYTTKFGFPYCNACIPQQIPKCNMCHLSIFGDVLEAMGTTWHNEHFLCTRCHMPLNEAFQEESYYEEGNNAFCRKCFNLLYLFPSIDQSSPKSQTVKTLSPAQLQAQFKSPEQIRRLKSIEQPLTRPSSFSPTTSRKKKRTKNVQPVPVPLENQGKLFSQSAKAIKSTLRVSAEYSFSLLSQSADTPAEVISKNKLLEERRGSFLLPRETREGYVKILKAPLARKKSISSASGFPAVDPSALTLDGKPIDERASFHEGVVSLSRVSSSENDNDNDECAVQIHPHSKVVEDITKFILLQDIVGKGGFAVVRQGVDLVSNETVAVKVFNKWELKGETLIFIQRETDTLSQLSHQNIRQFRQVYEDRYYMYVVMEFIDGESLYEYVESVEKLTEEEAKALTRSLLEAVEYLHSHKFIHQDIKTENILLERKKREIEKFRDMKLIDFGFARSVSENDSLKEYCGSYHYLAPEMILRQPYHLPIDLWSVGVVLYILLSGLRPFFSQQEAASGKIQWFEEDWETISPQAKDLVIKLLTVDASVRLTAKQALEHEWFK